MKILSICLHLEQPAYCVILPICFTHIYQLHTHLYGYPVNVFISNTNILWFLQDIEILFLWKHISNQKDLLYYSNFLIITLM